MICRAKENISWPHNTTPKVKSHFQLPSLLVQWSYQKKLPKLCTESAKVYVNKAQKIKSAYYHTYKQISDAKVLLRLSILIK